MEEELKLAHKSSSNHREEVLESEVCGCFYCTKIFPPTEIKEWADKGQTALCPYCGIDSVIGCDSLFPITFQFLSDMRKVWFDRTRERNGED